MGRARNRLWVTLALTVAGLVLATTGSLVWSAKPESSVVMIRVTDLTAISRHDIAPGTYVGPSSNPRMTAFFLVRNGDGWLALGNRSTGGLQCPVYWMPDDQIFGDRCRGVRYSRWGELVGGPAMHGLYRFPVTRKGDEYVAVDLRRSVAGPPGLGRHTFFKPQLEPSPAWRTAFTHLEERAEGSAGINMDSLEVVRNDARGEGSLMLISYRIWPDHPLYAQGERMLDLLSLDAAGQVVGGGHAGSAIVLGKQPFPVGWTWLGPPGRSDYAYFGPSGYAYYLDLTERDGTTSRVEMHKVAGWYLVKPFTGDLGTDWQIQPPAKIVGRGYREAHVFTRQFN